MNTTIVGATLDIQGVSKRFGTTPVLRDVRLQVAPGEFVAIVGKSGSGKSTLLRLIAGLEPPTGGRLLLDDVEVRGLNSVTRVMFQEARLLPWKTVRENVRLGLNWDHWEGAERALEQVGLADRAEEWPTILSGGQKQRVALARALAAEPRLLLLDEPLGALDALTRLEMQNLVERAWTQRQCTTLLVTHDVEEAVALADRVVVLEEGEIVMDCRVDLPRPRERGGAAFTRLRETVLARLTQLLSASR